MAKVLYPGSFDPLHNGHLDVIEMAVELFGEVVVAALHNPGKDRSGFTLEEREAILSESLAHLPTVSVAFFSGILIDLARDTGCDFVVKGLRTAGDFEVEWQMANMNHATGGVRTVFLPSSPANAFVSSRYVREIGAAGGDISMLVPAAVAKRFAERNR